MVSTYFDEKGMMWKFNFKNNKKICHEIEKGSYDCWDISPDWKSEKEMNDNLSKLCKELGYPVIDETIEDDFIIEDGSLFKHNLKCNNGVDLTLMVGDKMIMFELKNSGHCFKGVQGLGQLMYYMEQDEIYMKWRKKMGIRYNDYRKLKHSKLMGILVLADGRNIGLLLGIIKKIDYPIKILTFNPVILTSSIAKDNFIKSLKEVIE
jgi:hypothetical protein